MARIGINGFGRIGRLATRVLADSRALCEGRHELVRINEIGGDAFACAQALVFDSVHRRWGEDRVAAQDAVTMTLQFGSNGSSASQISCSRNADIDTTDWSDCDVVIEATGRFRKPEQLEAYFAHGVRRVVVAAPVKGEGVLNVVVGVNHDRFDPATHRIVTAASCTTNCLAPLVAVLHPRLGIEHGTILTVHDMTNTQANVDIVDQNFRRARAAGLNLSPTTTGSAKAISEIFPELSGRLNGLAVRVPLLNASITDFTFQAGRETSVEEVNAALEAASREGPLAGLLGFETRELVSTDFQTDPRSSIVDAQSTMVVDGLMVKVLAWYDNEWGYANRLAELVLQVVEA